MLARYEELLKRFGLRENRFGYHEEACRAGEAAMDGINRAAIERDRLAALFNPPVEEEQKQAEAEVGEV
jgi:hypothetical protein